MSIPSHFFYYSDTENEHYTRQATGNIAINRLMDGHDDYWVSPMLDKKRTPKTLVLSDWTLANMDEKEVDDIIKLLEPLLSTPHSFTLYVIQDDEILPLKKEDLSRLEEPDFREKIRPISDEEMIDKMAEKEISQSSLLSLDPHEIRQLSEQKSYPFEVRLEDILKSDFPLSEIKKSVADKKSVRINVQLLSRETIQFLRDNLFELSKIGNITFDIEELVLNASHELWRLLKGKRGQESYPSVEAVIATIIKAESDPSTQEALTAIWFMNHFLAISRLHLNQYNFMQTPIFLDENALKKVTYFDCQDTEINRQALSMCINKMKGLQKLKIAGLMLDDEDPLDLDEESFKELISLSYHGSDSDSDLLTSILCRANKLKDIYVFQPTFEFSKSIIHSVKLPQLENLRIFSNSVNNNHFSDFLNQCPNIKEMDIEGCQFQASTFNLDGIALNCLKRLSLEQVKIHLENLSVLLEQSKQLKTLTLRRLEAIEGDLRLHNIDLESLEIEGSLLSNITLSRLINENKNLKFLQIEYLNEFKGKLIFEENSYQQLENLIIKGRELNGQDIIELLSRSQKLKTLTLELHASLESLETLDPDGLKALESIALIKSNISATGLAKLLSTATHIKALRIEECDELTGILNLEGTRLLSLETLSIAYSDITPETLSAILNSAPNLKHIEICGSDNLNQPLRLNKVSLKSLVDLAITDCSNLSFKCLKSILSQSEMLETFSLDRSKIDNKGHLYHETRLTHLKTLSLNSSSMSLSFLSDILNRSAHLSTLDGLHSNVFRDDINLDKTVTFHNIKELDIHFGDMKGVSLFNFIVHCPNLETLTINTSPHLHEIHDIEINHLPSLRTLSINGMVHYERLLSTFLNHAPYLTTLDLSKSLKLEPIKLESLLNMDSLNQLETLNCDNSFINQASLAALIDRTKHLKSLSLASLKGTIETISRFENKFRSLENLTLSGTSVVSDCLNKILEESRDLKTLILSKTIIMNRAYIEIPSTELESVEYINVKGCNFPIEKLHKLILLCPNLNHIELDTQQKTALLKLSLDETVPTLQNCLYLTEAEIEKSQTIQSKVAQPAPAHTDKKLTDPTHSAQKHANTPKPKDIKPDEFEFKGDNHTKNQGMIIEKLSQFLKLTDTNLGLISEIQNGICTHLAHLFNSLSEDEWNAWLTVIHEWDGQILSITPPLSSAFDLLQKHITHDQFDFSPKKTYLGDLCFDFIKHHKNLFCLTNPWHAIAIKFDRKSGQYLCYDPNYVNGYKQLDESEVSKYLLKSLGPIIAVEGVFPVQLEKTIPDPDLFLREGGLLQLADPALSAILSAAVPLKDYSIPALEGLFLRSTNATPAWQLGLTNPSTQSFYAKLLLQYQSKTPSTFFETIKKSIQHMAPEQQSLAFNCLEQVFKPEDRLIDTPPSISASHTKIEPSPSAETLRYELLKAQYLNHFSFKKSSQQQTDLKSWLQAITTDPHLKRLVEIPDKKSVYDCLLCLSERCQDQRQPFFIVESPDDLVCDRPWIRKTGSAGVVRKGPGGRLYDFLTAKHAQDPPPLIVINYANFKTEDIIRFNTVLDAVRKTGTVSIPDNVKIIGLTDSSDPNAYQEADFYSRFNVTSSFPCPIETLKAYTDTLKPYSRQDLAYTSIHLFHGEDWRTQLLGTWQLNGDTLSFKEGELIKAIKLGKPILIENPPSSSEAFNFFLKDLISKKTFEGHPLPTISLTQGYVFETLVDKHAFQSVQSSHFYQQDDSFLLNGSSYPMLFQTLLCDNPKHSINIMPGLLQQHASLHPEGTEIPPLALLITQNLSEDLWAKLLHNANSLSIPLSIKLLPGVTLPDPLSAYIQLQPPVEEVPEIPISKDAIIVTNDIDASCTELLSKATHAYTIIDVTECHPSDLIKHLSSEFDDKTLSFNFEEQKRALLNALEKGEHVLLKGHFKDALRDALLPLLQHYPKQLSIVSDNPNQWGSLPHEMKHIDSAQKKALLADSWIESGLPDALLKEHDYQSLLAILKHQQQHPSHSTDIKGAWNGLYHLPIDFKLGTFDPRFIDEEIERFKASRLTLINGALQQSPIGCIAGLTGVGKSTFISNTLKAHQSVYMGEDKLAAWARDPDGGILFIDEANITQRDWSEFEGLFNRPPTILLGGEMIPLTPTHQVLFAFNPASYGGGRKVNRLFERHPNNIVFDPLPLNVIYGLILKPLFHQTTLAREAESLSKDVLALYQFLSERSDQKLLISIRELKSIVMLSIAKHAQSPDSNPEDIVRYYIREVASDLVPEKDKIEYNKRFPRANTDFLNTEIAEVSDAFIENETTRQITQSLCSFLDLRAYRQKQAQTLAPHQLNGGLGGFIIEGEPGVGKSHLVLDTLERAGIKEGKLDLDLPQENVYYHIPVNIPLKDKKALILKAFNEGNPIIMDEINSSPMMERLLNNLLMGKDMHDKWAAKPGFFIIGTQNPISMAGRQAKSGAQSRRVISKQFPLYRQDEMIDIFTRKGLSAIESKAMVEAFMIRRHEAIHKHIKPIPSFRDLNAAAETRLLEQTTQFPELNLLTQSLPVYLGPPFEALDKTIQSDLALLFHAHPEAALNVLSMLFENEEAQFDLKRLKQALTIHQQSDIEGLTLWMKMIAKNKPLFSALFEMLLPESHSALADFSIQQSSFFEQLLDYQAAHPGQQPHASLFNDIITSVSEDQDIKRAIQLFNLNNYIKQLPMPNAKGPEGRSAAPPSPFFHSLSAQADDAKLNAALAVYQSIKSNDLSSLSDCPSDIAAVLDQTTLQTSSLSNDSL